jgi:hypothetical protein
VQLIREGRGTQFDPVLVDAFLHLQDDFQLIRSRYEEMASPFDGIRLQVPGEEGATATVLPTPVVSSPE